MDASESALATNSATDVPQGLSAHGTQVNEDILDEAEVYVAHGQADLTIHLLQEYVRESPIESPVPWLLLFDLLSREGLESEYRAILPRVQNILQHQSEQRSCKGSGEHWTRAFLTELLYDRRGGTRQGFNPGTYREIMLLSLMAEEAVYAHSRPLVAPSTQLPTAHSVRELKGIDYGSFDHSNAVSPQAIAITHVASNVLELEREAPTVTHPTEPADLLHEAEWYDANFPANLTIPLLQKRLREAPTVPPVPWLQLLDLLARAGLEAEYQAARSEFKSLFNVNLSDHPAVALTPGCANLEVYPHVIAQFIVVWQTPDAEAFISNPVYDQRGGIRQGFELGTYREILLLHGIAEEYTEAESFAPTQQLSLSTG